MHPGQAEAHCSPPFLLWLDQASREWYRPAVRKEVNSHVIMLLGWNYTIECKHVNLHFGFVCLPHFFLPWNNHTIDFTYHPWQYIALFCTHPVVLMPLASWRSILSKSWASLRPNSLQADKNCWMLSYLNCGMHKNRQTIWMSKIVTNVWCLERKNIDIPSVQ